jgi:hypothetical protein
MKFTNGTELGFFGAKYSPLSVRFLGIGGVFGVLSWFIAGPAKPWLEGVSGIGLAAGLAVFLASTVAARRQHEIHPAADETNKSSS